jgi:hypothetical protein
VAAVFDAKAQNIARSLQMGIDASPGVLPDRPVSARSVAMES